MVGSFFSLHSKLSNNFQVKISLKLPVNFQIVLGEIMLVREKHI